MNKVRQEELSEETQKKLTKEEQEQRLVKQDKSRKQKKTAATALSFLVMAVLLVLLFFAAVNIGRLLVGSDHKKLIPFSMLLGAFTFLLADTIGRTITAPYEVSASIIMSVVGGPFFIILLRRSKKYAK